MNSKNATAARFQLNTQEASHSSAAVLTTRQSAYPSTHLLHRTSHRTARCTRLDGSTKICRGFVAGIEVDVVSIAVVVEGIEVADTAVVVVAAVARASCRCAFRTL